jgi:hypothetical protein
MWGALLLGAARVTWTTYDVPLNPDVGIGTQVKYNTNDGSDWSLGTTSRLGQLPTTAAWASTATFIIIHRQLHQ